MAVHEEPYQHHRRMSAEILASGGTAHAARWWSTTAWWAERERLSEGVAFRDDAPQPTAAYEGYDHQRLKRMLTENLSVSQVGDVSEAWSRLANAMDRFGERLREQVTRSGAVWQGAAADSAKSYTLSMAAWSEETGRCAELVSHQVSMQGDAATTARDRMPEPVPFDLRQEMAGWSTDPQNMNAAVLQALAHQQAHQDAKQEAVVVMTDYDDNLHDAAARQPVFPPPPTLASTGTHPAGTEVRQGTPPPANTAVPAGSAAPGTTAAAGFWPGAGGSGNGGGHGSARGPVPADGRQVGRTNPAMPFHSGGSGVPGAAGPVGPRQAGAASGPLAAAGATARRDDDAEHTNVYVVEDQHENYWCGDLSRPVSPVIGGEDTEEFRG